MKINDGTYVLEELRQMSTIRLEELLHDELQKDSPDGDIVRMILSILKERDQDDPEADDESIEMAWDKYLKEIEISSPKLVHKQNRMMKAAAIVAIVSALLFMTPQIVKADGLFERIVRWTDSIFELMDCDDEMGKEPQYVFKTNHPGLQQVYDAVTQLGVTEAVVPMWLPETYEFKEVEKICLPSYSYVIASFSNGSQEMVYQAKVYSESVSQIYQKDKFEVEILELYGTKFNIMQNDGRWSVIWVVDNTECHFSIECQEETLYEILRSIYIMRGD